jgi:ribosome-associated toxin RatA of RatAB toxin-antitoxin module
MATRSTFTRETSNARLLSETVLKMHEIKDLYGLSNLLDAAEHIVNTFYTSEPFRELKANEQRNAELRAAVTRN